MGSLQEIKGLLSRIKLICNLSLEKGLLIKRNSKDRESVARGQKFQYIPMRQFKHAQNDAKSAPKSMMYPPAQVFLCIVIMKKQSCCSKFL